MARQLHSSRPISHATRSHRLFLARCATAASVTPIAFCSAGRGTSTAAGSRRFSTSSGSRGFSGRRCDADTWQLKRLLSCSDVYVHVFRYKRTQRHYVAPTF